MSFFPPDPELPEFEETAPERRPWWEAPEDEFPALLPVTAMLATTEHVAVALMGVRAHRDGIQFVIERRLRRHGADREAWARMIETFMEHWHGGVGEVKQRLRYGVALSSGETAIADATMFPAVVDGDARPAGYSLTRRQAGGGGSEWTYESGDALWLWPVPPEGPLELVMQWPAFGIDERRTLLDGGEMRAATRRAQPLWA